MTGIKPGGLLGADDIPIAPVKPDDLRVGSGDIKPPSAIPGKILAGGLLDTADVESATPPDQPSIYSKAAHVMFNIGSSLATETLPATNPQTFFPAAKQAGSDIIKLGTQLYNASKGEVDPELISQMANIRTNISNDLSAQVSQISGDHPIDALYGLGYAVGLKPIQDLWESMTGVSAEDLKPLSIEDRTTTIKNTMANASAFATGTVVAKLLPEVNAGSSIVARMAHSAGVGAASGLVYGATQKAGTPEELSNSISSAIVFGTFGLAHGALSTLKDVATGKRALMRTFAPDQIAANASQLKQIQATVQSTMAEAVANEEALKTATSVPEAVLRGTISLDPNVTHIIPNIPLTTDIPSLYQLAKDANVNVEIRRSGDGVVDMLLPQEGTNVDMWRRTGYLPGQDVSVNGVRYIVRGNVGDNLTLEHADGSKVDLPINNVRAIPGESFTSPGIPRTQSKSVIPIQFNPKDIDLYRRVVIPKLDNGETIVDAIKDFSARQQKSVYAIHEVMGATRDYDILSRVTNANGYLLAHQDGAFLLKDVETGAKIVKLSTPEEVEAFINRSGQSRGNEQFQTNVGDGSDPPNIVSHNAPSQPGDNARVPDNPPQMGRLEKFFATITQALPWYTGKLDWEVAVDKLNGTAFSTRVGIPIRDAWMKWLAQAHPWLKQLQTIDKLLGKTNAMRRSIISGHIQAMSIPEMRAETNSLEQSHAQWLSDNDVDIQKVYDHIASSRTLIQKYQDLLDGMKDQENNPGIQKIMEGHKERMQNELQNMMADLSPSELEAVKRFVQIKRMPVGDASLFKITRLARGLQDPQTALTADDYAKVHNMTQTELRASKMLTEMWSNLGDEFEIPDARRITQYMNHYRDYKDMPQEASLRQRTQLQGKGKAPTFFSDLVRSGELENYIDDPVQAMSRYIQAGFRSRSGFNAALQQGREAAGEELKKIPSQAQNGVAKVINEFLEEARGIPDAGRGLMQDSWDKMMDTLGVKMPISLRNDIINGTLALTNSALLGFKPELGFRDIGVWTKMYYSRFGTGRMMNALKYAFEVDPKTGMTLADHLILQGRIAGLSPIDILSPEELTRMQLGGDQSSWSNKMKLVFEKIGETGLKVSGQRNFYNKIHAGAYAEAQRLAASNLLDLANNRITKEVAYNNLDMDSYDGPIRKRFDDLVTNGKYEEAADFLGRTTASEMAFIHGFGQHPYLWGTNWGRLLGQFGTFPVWERNFAFRLASRGTTGARIARMTRYIAAEAATKLAGAASGFNVGNWMMSYNMGFTGGPLVQTLLQQPAIWGQRGTRAQHEAIGQLLNEFSPGGFASMFIPGSYAFHDYMQAQILADKGYGAIPVFGRALGFSVDQTGRSFLDDWLGNYPQIKPNESIPDQILNHFIKSNRQ